MDPIVDASIQKSIRELSACGFASMLVIAHRIGTVMDFDKIIVLDKGVVVESGSPGELLKLPGGYFRGLAEDARETVKEAESQEMVVETGDDMEGLFVQESTYTSASRAVETRQSVSQSVVRRQSGAHCVETRHMQR
jgi:ABC-type multidrug transport system ATPase subunit